MTLLMGTALFLIGAFVGALVMAFMIAIYDDRWEG